MPSLTGAADTGAEAGALTSVGNGAGSCGLQAAKDKAMYKGTRADFMGGGLLRGVE